MFVVALTHPYKTIHNKRHISSLLETLLKKKIQEVRMDMEVNHQGLFKSHGLAKVTDSEMFEHCQLAFVNVKPCSCRSVGKYFDISLVPVVLCKDFIQVVCIHQPLWLCFHSSPASWDCLRFSPSLSSLDPSTPMSPFHTSLRHSERDLFYTILFVKKGLDYDSVCSHSVFLPWSESLRTWVAQKNLSSLSS